MRANRFSEKLIKNNTTESSESKQLSIGKEKAKSVLTNFHITLNKGK